MHTPRPCWAICKNHETIQYSARSFLELGYVAMPLVSRVGACVIQRLEGEWLVLICCLLRCHYMPLCFSSWCLRNPASTWAIAGFDRLPLMWFLSGCLRNRASTWGVAGFDLLPLMSFLSRCLRNRASTWGMAGSDVLCCERVVGDWRGAGRTDRVVIEVPRWSSCL